MKRIWTILLIITAIAIVAPSSFAQEASTQGKEFWVSFMGNGFKENYVPNYVDTQLLISSKHNCSGTITNPITGWTDSFNVEANNITTVNIPNEQAYNETSSYEVGAAKGLQIITSDTVSVYCTNIAANSFDASYVLPIQALADDYIVQTYDQSQSYTFGSSFKKYLTSAFLIVAVEDNTTVDITPSVTTLGGKEAGVEFTINLQAGEAYQVRSNNSTSDRDLTGTRVSSRDCKPIAVFNGNTLTAIPDYNNGYDHIFEQAMPLRSWGKKFVVTQSVSRHRDYVKIVSSVDGNTVWKNGAVVATLDKGQFYSFYLNSSEKSCFLETLGPSAVYLYNTTSADGKGTGDPSMLWISPIEQRLNEITLATFSGDAAHNSSISRHYINIIVATEDTDKVYFDGSLLPQSEFSLATGNTDYSFARMDITYDSHHLSCIHGFNAHVYGFGSDRGYAYMVGSNAADLTTTVTINELTIVPNDTVADCDLGNLSFLADINLSNYSLMWDFGDGTTSTDNPTTHQYDNNGLYEATLTVTTEEPPCGGTSTTNTTYFYIDSRREPDQDITDMICFRGPDNYTEHGFNLHYDNPGQYHDTYTITHESGCQSHTTLHLTVSSLTDTEPEIETDHCDSFEWLGNTYTASGNYTDTIPDSTGCYTIRHLNLELQYSPDPTDIIPINPINDAPHWVIPATEFQINNYEFQIWEKGQSHWTEPIEWSFSDTTMQWILEIDSTTSPPGKKCRMYVLNYTEDTVWLYATIKHHCIEEDIKLSYWFVCSFYDLDEQQNNAASFDVVPNPNDGFMDFCFGDIEGLVNGTIYDMKGTPIDQFSLWIIPNSRHSYHLKSHKSGMFLFVFNSSKGTITKKVIIK